VFPAYDKNGAITGYTSRTFRDHETRYLNPNTSEGFPEHKAIFGEHLWDGDSVVVTSEGAINVLSAHAVMPSINVAGLYGSHLKETQVLKLARFRKIVVLEDPDPTGRDYAVELKEAFFESDTRVVVAKMPDGYDPNALYCKDPEVLRCLIREAVK
jgi:DNA primase